MLSAEKFITTLFILVEQTDKMGKEFDVTTYYHYHCMEELYD